MKAIRADDVLPENKLHIEVWLDEDLLNGSPIIDSERFYREQVIDLFNQAWLQRFGEINP